MNKRLKSIGLTVLKWTVTLGCLYVVFTQIEGAEIKDRVLHADSLGLIASLAVFHLAYLIQSERTRLYYLWQKFAVNRRASLTLMYVGTMFNAVLPGGVGGDGYRIYLTKKHFHLPVRLGIRLALSNRLSGLAWLCLLTLGLMPFSEHLHVMIPYFYELLVLTALAGIGGYSLFARLVLKEPVAMQLNASVYSFAIQSLLLVHAALILWALGVSEHMVDYLVLFMVANVVANVPVSIGGVGLREITLLNGTQWLGLQSDAGVALTLIGLAMQVTVYLVGLVYYLRLPSGLPPETTHAPPYPGL